MSQSNLILKNCWNALCALKKQVTNTTDTINHCSLHIGTTKEVYINNQAPTNPNHYKIQITPKFKSTSLAELSWDFQATKEYPSLPPEIKQMLDIYLPYCFTSLFAQRQKRPVVISHFAQSLDGRIATLTGDSKWIGNQSNLIHSHRMRALCDAVLIGKNTLIRDGSKLTVRHVAGNNPTRVIIGASPKDLEHLGEKESAPTIVINNTNYSNSQITVINLQKENNTICPHSILKELYKYKICSIYLEGGAVTTSLFLQSQCIDIIQLHISPLIFGSGISSFSLSDIDKVTAATQFQSYQYINIGDAIMFVGQVKK